MRIQFLKDRIGFNIIDGGKILETRIFTSEKKMYDYLYKKMHTREYIEFLEI
jgi:hypothetical protein